MDPNPQNNNDQNTDQLNVNENPNVQTGEAIGNTAPGGDTNIPDPVAVPAPEQVNPVTDFAAQPVSQDQPTTFEQPQAQTMAPQQPFGAQPQVQPMMGGQVQQGYGGQPAQPQMQQAMPANESSKNYIVAMILSYLFGYFGVDRFYLGKIGTGILKLITFGGFGIWYIIDFFMIGVGKLKAKDGLELEGFSKSVHIGKPVAIIVTVLNLIGIVFMWLWFILVVIIAGGAAVQANTRDVERQTDIVTIQNNLEAFYASNGYYPDLLTLNDSTWRTKNMPKVDPAAFVDPNDISGAGTLSSVQAPNIYAYEAAPFGCSAIAADCQSFRLTATLETTDPSTGIAELYIKNSLN
jgi:TM2 domain-containing membrane protein YozV